MIVDYDKLADIREQNKDKKIVYTLGCFDLFHVGHLQYLEKAKQLGDILVVSVASDERVKQLKGEKRPVITAEHRISIVNSLKYVDYVISHPAMNEDAAVEACRLLKPDIFANGSEERVEKVGKEFPNIAVIYIPPLKEISTTQIIQKMGL